MNLVFSFEIKFDPNKNKTKVKQKRNYEKCFHLRLKDKLESKQKNNFLF